MRFVLHPVKHNYIHAIDGWIGGVGALLLVKWNNYIESRRAAKGYYKLKKKMI